MSWDSFLMMYNVHLQRKRYELQLHGVAGIEVGSILAWLIHHAHKSTREGADRPRLRISVDGEDGEPVPCTIRDSAPHLSGRRDIVLGDDPLGLASSRNFGAANVEPCSVGCGGREECTIDKFHCRRVVIRVRVPSGKYTVR